MAQIFSNEEPGLTCFFIVTIGKTLYICKLNQNN